MSRIKFDISLVELIFPGITLFTLFLSLCSCVLLLPRFSKRKDCIRRSVMCVCNSSEKEGSLDAVFVVHFHGPFIFQILKIYTSWLFSSLFSKTITGAICEPNRHSLHGFWVALSVRMPLPFVPKCDIPVPIPFEP